MPLMIISGTLPRASAITCQPSTTVLRNASVVVQPLCNDNDLTLSGHLAASHMPVAAPRDKPATWALSIPTTRMKAAMSSANNSVEDLPAGLSVSPAPLRSTEKHVKCLEYART